MSLKVASPTPIVPTLADSTSVILIRSPNAAARYAAVIHPAVPPPTMTTSSTAVAAPCPVEGSFAISHSISTVRGRQHLVDCPGTGQPLAGPVGSEHVDRNAARTTRRQHQTPPEHSSGAVSGVTLACGSQRDK